MKQLHHPEREAIQLSSVLYALSDPIRLYVVSEICNHGPQACNSFKVPIVKSTLTHHVRTLREAGLFIPGCRVLSVFCPCGRKSWTSGSPGCWIPYCRLTLSPCRMRDSGNRKKKRNSRINQSYNV